MTSSRSKKNASTLQECVASICRIVRDRGDITFVTACRESGYEKWRREVTPELIEAELRQSPDLIDCWLDWSSDKRWSPAWFFGERPNSRWVVGYHHDEPSKRSELAYADRFAA